MPRREFARIGTDMPDEPTIKALDVSPQWLYDRLLMRPEMSRCGVIPFRPALWAELATDATEQKVRKWLRSLIEKRHVIVDDRYAEVLIRTYVRHDGLLGQPNVVANMCSDFTLIASDIIRSAFLTEFRRLWDLSLSTGERGGWLLAVGVYPDAKEKGDNRSWPDVLTGDALARLRKAVKTGLSEPLVEAITEGTVVPFTEPLPEGFTEGFPEPLATALPKGSSKGSPNPLRGRDRGESLVLSRAPVPSAERQSQDTSHSRLSHSERESTREASGL